MNGFILGGRHNYAHPMEKNLVEADVRLAKFCADYKGTISSPTEHTWKRGDKCAKLDHGISWNSTLHPQELCSMMWHTIGSTMLSSASAYPQINFRRHRNRPGDSWHQQIELTQSSSKTTHVRGRIRSRTRCFRPQKRMTETHSWRCNGQTKR